MVSSSVSSNRRESNNGDERPSKSLNTDKTSNEAQATSPAAATPASGSWARLNILLETSYDLQDVPDDYDWSEPIEALHQWKEKLIDDMSCARTNFDEFITFMKIKEVMDKTTQLEMIAEKAEARRLGEPLEAERADARRQKRRRLEGLGDWKC